MIDKRGSFVRGKRFGWQTADAIFKNLFYLRDAIRLMFDAEGYPNTRELTRIRATYDFDTELLQMRQAGAGDRTDRMPGTLTRLGVGSYLCTFATPLPSADYDLQVTPGWGCDPALVPVMLGYGNKTSNGFELSFASWNGVAVVPCDPMHITISIGWDG